ncbi:MAG TPA: ATP-dependent endonuclease, partial [Methanofastidiosum sp.]|nr:ATP-dependent endonuclease [Methanofastidiosum sp.]
HMAHWINPDRGEMFFAKKVIFVEGETEKIILPFIAERLNIFDQDISIIDCGSKHNLPLYIVIANAFNISYLVIHDEDPLPVPIPNDWNENKKNEKQRAFALNSEIRNLVRSDLGGVEVLSADFEEVSAISKREGEKKGKALAALDFFENANESEISQRLKELVEKVYDKKNIKI